MSDFAYEYFNSELDKLDIPSLQKILDKCNGAREMIKILI